MRTLTTPTSDAASALTTQPGWLVEIGFTTPLRLSSRGTVETLGNTFTGWDVQVSGIAVDGTRPATSGSLTLGDHDQSISALVLGQGLAGREVRVWRYFAEAIDDLDPVLMFFGVAAQSAGGAARQIQVALVAREASVLYSPRRYMTRESGFSVLPPTGKVITFNGERYALQGER
jgi:hypothetical protein